MGGRSRGEIIFKVVLFSAGQNGTAHIGGGRKVYLNSRPILVQNMSWLR